MSVEATPVTSAPKRTPVEGVLECLRNRAPNGPSTLLSLPSLLPFFPKGTPLQHTATWPGPPSDPPPEFTEAEPQRWHIGADANPPWQWCARERVLIKSMEDYLERSVCVFFLTLRLPNCNEDNGSCVLTFAESVCDERGRKKFAVLEKKRGVEVGGDTTLRQSFAGKS